MSLAEFSTATAVTYTDAWPEDRVDRLKYLWNVQKWSAGKIAAEFGISRNAVIGKKNRLGILMDARGRIPGRERIRQRQNGGGFQFGHRARLQARQATAPVAPDQTPADFVVPVEQRKTFFQLESGHCRWPSSKHEVGHPDFYFCGGTIDESHQSYCSGHAALSWRRR